MQTHTSNEWIYLYMLFSTFRDMKITFFFLFASAHGEMWRGSEGALLIIV